MTAALVDAPRAGLLDVPEADYHADTASLSSSGARRLIRVTPAHFRHEQDHPEDPTDAMVFGSAWHSLVLRDGPAVVEIEADSWRTNAAKDAAKDARAAGGIPLLTKQFQRVSAMAARVREHELAGPLLASAEHVEASGWWVDEATGVTCRVRFDAVCRVAGRLVVVDIKTLGRIGQWARAVDEHGYDQQQEWYCEALVRLGLTDEWPDFLFVVQETEAPHLVSVQRLDGEWGARGYARNQRAREVFAQCTAAGDWPGYPPEIHSTPMPRWASVA